MELALRFLALRRTSADGLTSVGDLGDFLTRRAREMAVDQDYNREEEWQSFVTTFETLNRCTSSDSFRRFDPDRGRHVGGFLVSAFEAVALGIGHIPANAINEPEELTTLIRGIWSDTAFTESAGSGVRASTRIPRVVKYGRERFQR